MNNEEIKEILYKFDKILENYELDKKFGQFSVDSICHLFPQEIITIKNYITNLPEKVKNQKKEIQRLYKQRNRFARKYDYLKQENEKLKCRNKILAEDVSRDVIKHDVIQTVCGIPIEEIPELINYKSKYNKVLELLNRHDKDTGDIYYKYNSRFVKSELKERIREIK